MPSNNLLTYRVSDAPSLRQQIDLVIDCESRRQPLSHVVATEHSSFRTPSVRGFLAERRDVERLRDEVNGRIRDLSGQSESDFDVKMSTTLFDEMRLLPAQAGEAVMWQTMAAFILPELVIARFGDTEKSIRERMSATRRNALSRLWFRRQALSLEAEERYKSILNQDLVQQIVERPSIASDPRLVSLVLQLIEPYVSLGSEFRKFYREALKEVTLLAGVCLPQAMSDEVLANALRGRFDRVAESLTAF